MAEHNDDIDDVRERRRAELRESGQTPATPDEPVYIDGAAELQELVSEHNAVLVDFHADWCGPCQMLEPTLESLAADENTVVAKVDVDANQELAAEHGVQGVPNVILFADGEPTERVVGVRDERFYAELVARAA